MARIWKEVLGAGLLAGSVLTASSAQALGIIEAYDLAMQNDPQYRAAQQEQLAGLENERIGRANVLPVVQFSYSASKNKAEQTAPNLFGGMVTTYPEYTGLSTSLSMRQPLLNLDATARYKQGKAQARYADAQFSSKAQDTIVRLFSAYADAKFAEDQLALFRVQREAYAEQMRANQRMFEKGEGTKTDMLETQARLDVAEAQVIEAEDNLHTAREMLAGIIGQEVAVLDGLQAHVHLPPLDPRDLEGWKALAQAHSPDLQAAQQAYEVASLEVSRTYAGHAPRIDLNAGYTRSISDSLTTQKQDSAVKSIGVQLVVPIYSGGYVNATTRQASANREKARADLDTTRNKVLVEVRRQFGQVQSGVLKMAALEKSEASALELVNATEQSVKGGVRVNLDVLNAQQQLAQVRRDLAQARYNYLTGYLRLRQAAGVLDAEDLRQVARCFTSS